MTNHTPFSAAVDLDKGGIPPLSKGEGKAIASLSPSLRRSVFVLFTSGAFTFSAAPFIQLPEIKTADFDALSPAEQIQLLRVLVRASDQRQTAMLAIQAAAKQISGVTPMAYAALGLGAGYVVNKAKPLVWLALGAGAYYIAQGAADKKLKDLQHRAEKQVKDLLAQSGVKV